METLREMGDFSGLLAQCLDHAGTGIAILAPDGQCLHVSEALCRLTGHPREELLADALAPPGDLEKNAAARALLLSGPSSSTTEKRFLRPDSQIIWLRETTSLFRHPDGSPRCFILHFTDITADVRARLDLRALAERLELATAAAQVGLIDYDIPRAQAFWDARMYAIYGLPIPPDGLIDVPTWMPSVHPDDLEDLLAKLRKTITDGSPLSLKYRILHPRTGERTLLVDARVVRDESGAPLRCVAVTRDITEKEQIDLDLRSARDAAESASRAKSAFLATMSHEIRTPLHGILGYTDLLAESPLSDAQRSQLTTIEKSGEMLLSLIEDILDYSKIESGKLALKSDPFSLTQCLRDSVSVLAPRASDKELTLTLIFDPGTPETVLGDKMRLRQVFINLLANAVKFTATGEIKLHVRPGALPDGAPAVHFQVTDTGIGIPPEKIAGLFEPFRQLDTSHTRRFGGTGLGLAICRSLVTGMQGRIHLSSHEGLGTTIDVHIPFLPAPAQTTPEESAFSPSGEKTLPALALPPADLRILVAEDNSINRRLIRQMLLRGGVTNVEVVNDGEEALERLAHGNIDVVLMDCQMPRLDGYEATREIRRLEQADPLRPRVRIVALTASAFDEDRQRARDVGMDAFLTKPLRPDALARALTNL